MKFWRTMMILGLFALMLGLFQTPVLAITGEGIQNYQDKIQDAKELEDFYRKNQDFYKEKDQDTSWWNPITKLKWKYNSWTSGGDANNASKEGKFWQNQLDEERRAAERQRQRELEQYKKEQTQNRERIDSYKEKIKELGKDQEHYKENYDFYSKKYDETSWWNLPEKLKWMSKRNGAKNELEEATTYKNKWEEELDGTRDRMKEAKEDNKLSDYEHKLMEKAARGSEVDAIYLQLLQDRMAYEEYSKKLNAMEKMPLNPLTGLGPQMMKVYYQQRMKSLEDHYNTAQADLKKKLAETTKANTLDKLGKDLQNKTMK